MAKLRLSKAVSLFLAWARKNRAPGTVAGYAHYLKKFVKAAKDRLVKNVTPAVVETWSNKWHAIQAVQRLFAWLVTTAKRIKVNPLAGLKLPRTKMRRRVLTVTELVALLRAASRPLRRLLMAMQESIARPGELREATWESIRAVGDVPWTVRSLCRGACFFHVLAGKGYQRRTDSDDVRLVPINPRLGRMLVRLLPPDGHAAGPVFLDDKGRRWTGTTLRERMRRLRRRCGIAADWRGERVVAYTFRHTSATAAVAAGVRDAMLSAIMGHSTPRMTRRYVHLQPDMIQKGLKRIVEVKTARMAKNKRLRSRRKHSD